MRYRLQTDTEVRSFSYWLFWLLAQGLFHQSLSLLWEAIGDCPLDTQDMAPSLSPFQMDFLDRPRSWALHSADRSSQGSSHSPWFQRWTSCQILTWCPLPPRAFDDLLCRCFGFLCLLSSQTKAVSAISHRLAGRLPPFESLDWVLCSKKVSSRLALLCRSKP